MSKSILLILILFLQTSLYAQVVVKPSEQLIYSFETVSQKKALIAYDTANRKMVYRFGTKKSTELEISHDTSSYTCDYVDTNEYKNTFSYNFYYRCCGAANLGENDNYFEFINNGFFYSVYYEYTAVGNSTQIGIRVTNLTTNKESEINGILKTQKGGLDDYRLRKFVLNTYGKR